MLIGLNGLYLRKSILFQRVRWTEYQSDRFFSWLGTNNTKTKVVAAVGRIDPEATRATQSEHVVVPGAATQRTDSAG